MVSSTKLKREEGELRKIAAGAKTAAKQQVAATKKAAKADPAAGKAKKDDLRHASKFMNITEEDRKSFKNPELAKELATKAGVVTPPFRHEVHVKKEQLTIIVTLHNVPPQKIDNESATDSVFIISTPGHTKHYRLEFPYPHGMRVDSANGDYTYENGELKAVFKITKMPVEVVRDWNDRLESIRKSQKARFEVTKEGDLVVRKRKTTLELKDIAAHKAKKAAEIAAKYADKKAKGDAKKKEASAESEAKPKTAGKKTGEKAEPSKPKNKVFVPDDKAKLKGLAAAAAAAVQKSAKERLQQQREAYERKLGRKANATANKDSKAVRMSDAFARVLDEKRKALEAMRPAVAPVAAAASAGRRSVTFSK